MNIEKIEKLVPDKDGTITVEIKGFKRKFVKEKLINYLCTHKSNGEVRKAKLPKKSGKPIGTHKRTPVTAILKDGTEHRYNSITEAATALGLDRSNIPHVISGKYKHVGGVRFKKEITN